MSHRLYPIVTVTAALALLFALVPAAVAQAADITIDYPEDGGVVMPADPDGDGIETVIAIATFAGMLYQEDIIPYVDGIVYAGCRHDIGTGPVPESAACVVSRSGSEWRFYLVPSEFERYGLEFFGKHTLTLVPTTWDVSNARLVEHASGRASVAFTIGDPAAAPIAERPAALAPIGPPPVAASASRLASGSASAPSVLSATTRMQDVALSPERALLTALVAVILLLIVGFPGTLLGSTIGKHYDRIFGRFARWFPRRVFLHGLFLRGRARRRGEAVEPVKPSDAATQSWGVIAMGMVAATIISGFVDPGFGFNPGSLRMLVSVAIAFVLESLLGWWLITRLLRRSDPELNPRVRFRFGSLLVLVLAVLLSRLVGFEPGMVFGLIVGLSYGATLATARKARVSLIGSAYAFVLAVLGWIGYSILTAASGNEPGFWITFASETFSGLAVSGIASLPLALLPIGVLEGGTLFAWKKWVWGLAYGIGTFAFLVILMPMPFSWGEIGTPFATWIALYAGYALLAVGVWSWFTFVKPRASAKV